MAQLPSSVILTSSGGLAALPCCFDCPLFVKRRRNRSTRITWVLAAGSTLCRRQAAEPRVGGVRAAPGAHLSRREYVVQSHVCTLWERPLAGHSEAPRLCVPHDTWGRCLMTWGASQEGWAGTWVGAFHGHRLLGVSQASLVSRLTGRRPETCAPYSKPD